MAKRVLVLLIFAGLVGVATSRLAYSEDKAPAGVGKKIGDFKLTDPRTQKQVALADLKDKKAIVVLFLGTECPVNNLYLISLAQMNKDYADKGVQFLGINSNVQDNAESIAAHAKKNEIPFPVLHDEGNKVADQFGAVRVPQAFVLDGKGTICYQGRIDDQFGIGYQKPKPTTREMLNALDEVIEGKTVSVSSVPVAGCIIGRARKEKDSGTVTYAKEISRIMQAKCQECHRPGQVGPMPLMNYRQVSAWSEMIKETVLDNRMPPWHADPKQTHFKNVRRLSDKDKAALVAWVDQGCPKGDDKDLPKALVFDDSKWKIGKPDAIFTMAEEVDVPAETPKGGVPYKYFTIDPGFKEDMWVEAAESKAGAAPVVHHIIVFISAPNNKFVADSPGAQLLCGTAPGDTALMLPAGVAKKIPAGAKFVFQMHYTPNGKAYKDRSSVALKDAAKEPPKYEALTVPVAYPFFRLPAGADNVKVESKMPFSKECQILSFMPHMHVRGKDFRYLAIQPDGKTDDLLTIPRYDFNWQNTYRLEKPYLMPKGSMMHCIAHFDNSTKNPNNPDPTKEVRWGDQTWEEMMIGWMEVIFENKPKEKAKDTNTGGNGK